MQTQTQPKKVGRPKNPYPHVLTPKGFNGWSKAKKREWLLAEIERTKIAKAENLARLVAAKKANKIEFFTKPNPPQQKFIEAFLNPQYKVLAYVGGNRCLDGTTRIYDPVTNETRPVSEIKGDHHVRSFDGENVVIAKADAPFTKGKGPMFLVTLSTGESFAASDTHLVLTLSGYRAISELHPGCAVFPLPTTLEPSPSTRLSSEIYSQNKGKDFQCGCPIGLRSCDGQLLWDQDTFQDVAQQQDDEHGHMISDFLMHEGGLGNTPKDNRFCLLSAHPSILDDLDRSEVRCVESEYHVSCICQTHVDSCNQSVHSPISTSFSPVPPNAGFGQWANRASCTCYNHDIPLSLGLTSFPIITSIKYLYDAVKWDFNVPIYHNYIVGGAIHHNSGKTTIGIILALCYLFGELPWDKTPIVFPHSSPRKVRIVGQDFEKHIKTVLEPKLVEWWPQSRPVEVKKNNVGVKAFWKDEKTGSTLEILSNMSESDVAEGWDGDLILYDEPPKRDMRIACARGLVDRQGKEMFTMTLLKEAWIAREVLKAQNEDGTPDTSVFVTHATIYDNVGYGVTSAGVSQFEKTLTDEEKQSRLLGIPSYMSNIIWILDRNTHLRPRFPVPLDWIVDVQIDFHPAKPWAVQFLATTPQNFKWVVEEMWKHGNPKFMAEEIIRSIHRNNYRVGAIEIDPLSKGDSNNDETVFEIMRRTFNSFGYSLRPASKDKDNGIAVVRNWLKSENGMPTLYFFNDLKKTVEQVENWVVDPDTLKPSKVDDDFCECLYRHGLRNTMWFEDTPEEEYQPRYAARNAYTGY